MKTFRSFFLAVIIINMVMASQIVLAASDVGRLEGNLETDQLGNARYEIPLDILPVANIKPPKLSLAYSSQSTVTEIGYGWSLGGFSYIRRCRGRPQDGSWTPPPTMTSSDRFCLDGNEVVAVNGEYGKPKTEYRTRVDLYSKIVSNGLLNSGPQSFTVHRKDGMIDEYGTS